MFQATRRQLAATLAIALLGGFATQVAPLAQAAEPLTIIVPSAAGSAPDIIARIVGNELREPLGQPVVIDNRPGAGGIVAVMAAKSGRSPANTLLLAQAAVATVTPLTYRAARFDMERDFEAVSVVAQTPMLIVANPAKGPKTLAEAVAQGKAQPESLTLSSPSRGSIPHLSAELLQQATGARFTLVPMSGSGQALQSVAAGDSQVSVDGISALLPLVKAGRLRALGVTSDKPLPGLESLPLAKTTVPGLEMSGWFMLFAPKGVDDARVKAINAAVSGALASPAVTEKRQASAHYAVGGSPADARAFLAREKRKWAAAVERAGLKPE